jgi:hypothetical protein
VAPAPATPEAGTSWSPLMLRRHFARMCGTTPQAYRRTFSQAEPGPPGHRAEREEQGAQGQRANAHLKHDDGDQQDVGDVAEGGS